MSEQDEKQAQLLTALDKIATRLIRMEKERNILNKEVTRLKSNQSEFEDALIKKADTKISSYKSEQQRLRNLVNTQKQEQEELKKKLLETEQHRKSITNITQTNMQKALDESLNIQRQMRQELEMNSVRQARLEEELLMSQQKHTKLLRKLDSMSTKYQRLTQKIERVEANATAAQEALQAKAMVLLSDQSLARDAGGKDIDDIEYSPKSGGFPKIAAATNDDSFQSRFKDFNFPKLGDFKKSAASIAIVFAVGLFSYTALNTNWSGIVKPRMSPQEIVVRNLDKPDTFVAEPEEILATNETEQINTATDVNATTETPEDLNTAQSTQTDTPTSTQTDKTNTNVIAGLEPDTKLPQSFKTLEKEAFAGKGEAQHDLAALYSAGNSGVEQNFQKAAYWFEAAAENGIANARYNLGVLHHQGLGLKRDLKQAMYWYGRAAELGHPEAQYNLGIANIEGIGTEYNPKLAVAYFKQAANNGVPEAAYNLGLILENGLLGSENIDEAIYWYSVASSAGNEGAAAALSLISKTSKYTKTDIDGIIASYDSAYADNALAEIEPASGYSANTQQLNVETSSNETTTRKLSNWERLVADIQGQLKLVELYNGPEDGIYGPQTRDAIKAYEESYNLPLTGEPSRDLLAHMQDRTAPLEQGSSN